MYLVDTSVWIDYLLGKQSPHVLFLDELAANPIAAGITDVIYQEILQGARDQAIFNRWRSYFANQLFYRFDDPASSHANAAQLYLDCRRQGVTVRSSADCLIAQCAIEHDLILLHHDRDFKNIAPVIRSFRQKNFL